MPKRGLTEVPTTERELELWQQGLRIIHVLAGVVGLHATYRVIHERTGLDLNEIGPAIRLLRDRGMVAVSDPEHDEDFDTRVQLEETAPLEELLRVPLPKRKSTSKGRRRERIARKRKGTKSDPKRVFIIYGRNVDAANGMISLVRSLGLEPMTFEDAEGEIERAAPFIGEVVEYGMRVSRAAIAIFTPDEKAHLRDALVRKDDGESQAGSQARQNVTFEAGMAMGLAPDRTFFVTFGPSVRMFSDSAGRYIRAVRHKTDLPGMRDWLRKGLSKVKCKVKEKSDFRKAGARDFAKALKLASSKDKEDRKRPDQWRRCGNIYWLGNNIAYAAAAIAVGNIGSAQLELGNALQHSMQLDIGPPLRVRIRVLRDQQLETPEDRRNAINALIQLGSEIGKLIARRQPDFAERDVKH